MLRNLLGVFFLNIVFFSAHSQNATVYGTVRDEAGLPIDDVYVESIPGADYSRSDAAGKYRLEIPAGNFVIIRFTHVQFETIRDTIRLTSGQQYPLYEIMSLKVIEGPGVTILDENRTEAGIIKLNPKNFEYMPGTSDLAFLKFVGASSGNELSSQYSVRGGNFDENLVYVNDFEIYRPFLVRSSQQEGLSFVNIDMISSLAFSAGGFQAKYGDKLSSVLDIQYKEPKKFEAIVSGSLLGGSLTLGGASKNHRFTLIGGGRYKTNQYLLNSLETKGDYRPVFTDVQAYSTYDISDKVELEAIGNFSGNVFQFIPADRSTTFGLINATLRLDVYFDGQEVDRYLNTMGGIALNFHPRETYGYKFMASVYRDQEDETYDLIGEYFLGIVESNLGSEDFGQTLYGLGTGTTHEWGRDFLDATVGKVAYKSFLIHNSHNFQWGADVNREIITDDLSQWDRIDSAGYNLPYSVTDIHLQNVIRTQYDFSSWRTSAYVQDGITLNEKKNVVLNVGARMNYWDFNGQIIVSPRAQISYAPEWKSDLVFRAAVGAYDQPPFYRELRDLYGELHPDVKAQRSVHILAGTDINFDMWGRRFKFVTEAYYKYLYDLNPYEVDNVRITYFGENDARGYAAGIDFRLNGDFVKDAESWITLSLLRTRENLDNDVIYDVTEVLDSTGVVVGYDSSAFYPENIPRPTDQLVNFALFFQDYIPGNENFKVHLNLLFGSGLPTGPPDHIKARDTLRLTPYRRVDIGFSALLVDGSREKIQHKKIWKHFDSIWTSLEVFNLLGVPNEISYTWVKDLSNTVYAVPNYLTSRRLNLRLLVKF